MPAKRISNKMKKKQLANKPLYIKERVAIVREQLQLTHVEISRRLGVTAAAVGQAERNNGGLLFEVIILFANSYGINPAWILVEDNSKVSQVIERKDPGQIMPEITPVEADNLDSGQLATRIRRDILKLKEVAANEALAKAKKKKAK